MGYKKATCIANGILIALAIAFIVMALNFKEGFVKLVISEKYYPIGVAGLLIVACIISTIKTLAGDDDHKVEIKGWKNILLVLGTCIVFALLWKYVGHFYVIAFVLMSGLMYVLNPEPHSKKKVLKTLLTNLAIVLVIYVGFERLLNFRF